LVRTTSKRDAEKIGCVAAATVEMETPEVQLRNPVVVGLHVVMAYEAERFVSRASGRFCLGLAVIFAVRVKECPQFSRITFVYYNEHACVSRTSCIMNCNARVFQNTHLANVNSTD
jgi:hypothetical protein